MSTPPDAGHPERPAHIRPAVPRGLIILVALASAVIAAAGLRQVADIVGPLFLALCLTITVHPIRTWLQRKGWPRWLATLAVIVAVYAIVIGLIAAIVWAVARFATLLPTYTPQMQDALDGIARLLGRLGIDQEQIGTLLSKVDVDAAIDLVGSIINSVLGIAGLVVLVVTLVLFLCLDSVLFTDQVARQRRDHGQILGAFDAFAGGTRRYFAVSTIFGAIVAACDYLALLALGVPAAFLWALLAFVTNYIPNVGFLIGLAPAALLALLTGGVGTMIAVIVIYVVLNFVIQSMIQTKFIGDAVGLTSTASFLSLIVWSFILGPLGAVLAIPMTLLAKAIFIDHDPQARWMQMFIGQEPDLRSRRERKAATLSIKPAPSSPDMDDSEKEPSTPAG